MSVSVQTEQKVPYVGTFDACGEDCSIKGKRGDEAYGWAFQAKQCSDGKTGFVCSPPISSDIAEPLCPNQSNAVTSTYFTQGQTISSQATPPPVGVTCQYDLSKLVPEDHTSQSDANVQTWLEYFSAPEQNKAGRNNAAQAQVLQRWCAQTVTENCPNGASTCRRSEALTPSASWCHSPSATPKPPSKVAYIIGIVVALLIGVLLTYLAFKLFSHAEESAQAPAIATGPVAAPAAAPAPVAIPVVPAPAAPQQAPSTAWGTRDLPAIPPVAVAAPAAAPTATQLPTQRPPLPSDGFRRPIQPVSAAAPAFTATTQNPPPLSTDNQWQSSATQKDFRNWLGNLDQVYG